MTKSVFEFRSYKTYLAALAGPSTQRRGMKSKMAAAIGCQPTFISQVFHGKAHLSLEQADQLNLFLGHTTDQSDYFLLLVQRERSGTPSLQRHFDNQIETVLEKRMTATHRLELKTKLSQEAQAKYYCSWQYAAIHIALTIPSLRKPEQLSEFFKIPMGKVNLVLDFLVTHGLAVRKLTSFEPGVQMVRLANDSSHILRHHANWRQAAMESLDREGPKDLHYSGVVSLSAKDVAIIKDRLLEQLKENIEIVRRSPEEELYSYNVDFFSMKR